MSGFLESADLNDLTEIRKGKDGKTRDQLQIEYLREKGIPFIVSARGRARVTWAAVEGYRSLPTAANQAWQPNVLKHPKAA
jgi:hypothetical protein